MTDLITSLQTPCSVSPGGSISCADNTGGLQSPRVIWPQPLLCSHHVCGLPSVWPRPHPSILSRPPTQLQRGLQSNPGRFSRECVCICSSPDAVRLGGSGDGAPFLHGLRVLGPGEADGQLFWAIDMLRWGSWKPQDGKQTSIFYWAAEKTTGARVRAALFTLIKLDGSVQNCLY